VAPQGIARGGTDNAARAVAQQERRTAGRPCAGGLGAGAESSHRSDGSTSHPQHTAAIPPPAGSSLRLKVRTSRREGKPLEIIGSGETTLPLDLYLGESQPPFPPLPVFETNAPGLLAIRAGEKKSVLLSWESASGVRIVREYRFSGDRYDFEVGEQVSNGSREPIRLRPGVSLRLGNARFTRSPGPS
jgi:hypothetical protein